MAEELRQRGIEVKAIIPVPTDDARFTPASATERAEARERLGISADVTIVFTGHLEPRKGVDLLLKAFDAVLANKASAHLLLVGGNHGHAPDLGPVLVDYVRSRSLERSVTFTGVVDDVETYLHASDIFCLPSEREGMSNSLVEAMACGLACVAPASAGGDDLLADGAGLVPASNAANDLAASLTSLIADRELRLRLGRAAAARVQAHSLSAVIDAYEKLFEMVPTKRGRPAPLPQRTVH
jgi:glycosyltransferase involved in cell wall biosynthesis